MNILAIETSCDETAIAIIKDGREIKSNVILSQIEEHKLYGGVVPEIASRRHVESISAVFYEALKDANMTKEDIDAVGVTYSPGLIGALLVGVNFAKGLAYSLNKPLIPVHHIRGHIAANYLTHENLKPPFLALVVSGGHSNIIEVLDYTTFNVLGRTFDDAAGEAFDKAGRTMGLPYPGGVYIDLYSKKGQVGDYKLPSPKVDGRPYDFSFSGLKTALINLVHRSNQREQELNLNNLSADFNHTVVEILKERTFLAARNKGYKKIVVSGGVSANSLLREEFYKKGEEENIEILFPKKELCGDNAAMIGSQAYYEYKAGHLGDLSLNGLSTKDISENYTIV